MDKLWISLLLSVFILISVHGFDLPDECKSKAKPPAPNYATATDCGKKLVIQRDAFYSSHTNIATIDWKAVNKAKGLDKENIPGQLAFPAVETYYDGEDIAKHLGQFKGNVAYLVADSGLEAWYAFAKDLTEKIHGHKTPPTLGYQSGLFVTTEAAINELLKNAAKEGTADAALKMIANKLGFPTTWFSDKKETLKLLKISFDSRHASGLRMATGNEDGASNLWLPGGYLPGGLPEGILNPVTYGVDKINMEIVYSKDVYKDDKIHTDNLTPWAPHNCEACKELQKEQAQKDEQCKKRQRYCAYAVVALGLGVCIKCIFFRAHVEEYNYLQDTHYGAKSDHYNHYNQFMDEYGMNDHNKYISHHGHNQHHYTQYASIDHQQEYLPYNDGYETEYNYTSQLLLAIPIVLLCVGIVCIGYLCCLAFGGVAGYLISHRGRSSNKSSKYVRINNNNDADYTEDV